MSVSVHYIWSLETISPTSQNTVFIRIDPLIFFNGKHTFCLTLLDMDNKEIITLASVSYEFYETRDKLLYYPRSRSGNTKFWHSFHKIRMTHLFV